MQPLGHYGTLHAAIKAAALDNNWNETGMEVEMRKLHNERISSVGMLMEAGPEKLIQASSSLVTNTIMTMTMIIGWIS